MIIMDENEVNENETQNNRSNQSRPKTLPPSLRSHKRYIAFEIISEEPILYKDIMSAVWASMLSFVGEKGGSEASMWFIHNLYSKEGQKGILRCNHDFVEQLRAVLSLIHIIGETRAVVKILGVTGTIRSAKTKYLTPKTLEDFEKK